MKRLILPAIIILLSAGCEMFSPVGLKPKTIELNPRAISKEGWRGQEYYTNGVIRSGEYDSLGNDGKYDIWRYYQAGKINRQELDRNGDDLIDLVTWYDLKTGRIISFSRDTDFNGSFDNRLENTGFRKWTQKLDTTGDGKYDSIAYFTGKNDFLKVNKINPETVGDLRNFLPYKIPSQRRTFLPKNSIVAEIEE
jgi:hypothetical protein